MGIFDVSICLFLTRPPLFTSSCTDRSFWNHRIPRICWVMEVRMRPHTSMNLIRTDIVMFRYIADWQKVFRFFDRDQSGTIDGTELAAALRQFGYNLNPTLLMLLEQKYGKASNLVTSRLDLIRPFFVYQASLPNSYGAPGGINFDRFVRACVMVKTLTEAFQK